MESVFATCAWRATIPSWAKAASGSDPQSKATKNAAANPRLKQKSFRETDFMIFLFETISGHRLVTPSD